jgi:hypothetical protein
LDAKAVMNKMGHEERGGYLAGIVEGLAYARYVVDGKQTNGMNCIYDWFYKDETSLPSIIDAFDKFPDHYPGAIMAALVKKKCG